MELASLFNSDGITLGGVVTSLIAAFVWLVIGRFLSWSWDYLVFRLGHGKTFRLYHHLGFSFPLRYLLLFLATFLAGAGIVWLFFESTSRTSTWLFLAQFITATILLHAIFRDWSFHRVGLARAEKSVAKGTDYEGSLLLSTSSIAFMGTGAYKLTSSSGFEAAVERCMTNGGSVRLLISRPDVPPLKKAEKMADVDPGAYGTKVRSTLKLLRTLKRDRAFPIEVRFHNRDNTQRMQEFRMMFVDNKHLFLSYNLYGHGDGSDIAQLVLKRKSQLGPLRSFYHPFNELFERVWSASTRWDFNEYIED